MAMMYNPRKYWRKRGRRYKSKPVFGELEFLARRFRELAPEEILEVGSGYGRVFSFLQDMVVDRVAHYMMCDFVDSMIDGCERETGIRPARWDGVDLPYPDRTFSMVLSFSVMLHVPPSDIDHFLAEHVRVSRRWLYVATMAQQAERGLAPHCFDHMYGHLFDGLGLRVVERVTFADGARVHWLLEI